MKRFTLAVAGILTLTNISLTSYAAESTENGLYEYEVEDFANSRDWIYTFSWRIEGDTVIISGEGPITRDNQLLLRLQMENVRHVRFENCKIIGGMQDLFMGMGNLESIDFTGLDTSQVTDMSNLFYGCSSLTSLDLSGLDTSQVEEMDFMFQDCTGLQSLNLSNFDTSRTNNMFAMFRGCNALKSLDISSFDMTRAISTYMLDGCSPDVIHTPKALNAGGEIILSGKYFTLTGEMTEKITEDFLSALLIRMPENIEAVNGFPFAVHEGNTFLIDGDQQVRCYRADGTQVINEFQCDGTYTYYFQADGTAMRDRLTYHPDGIHVIYFDRFGHEVFSDFANVKQSIEGYPVDDMCFFNSYGYMYIDTLTYDKSGTKLYYVNPYGVLERKGWFPFSGKEFDAGLGFSGRSGGYGYANPDCSLLVNTNAVDWYNQTVYIQGDGHMFYD